jgi:flagellar hook assembly protein FlgD
LIFGTATDAPPVGSLQIAAYPNPFTTRTRLALPKNARRVRVFDLSGRAVRTLEGAPVLTWDGSDDAGRALPGGVYWVRAEDVVSAPLKVVRIR